MVSGEVKLPLIWSLSRKLRRRFCPRAAVMHYREARSGFAPDADENCRRINALHRLVPQSKYIRQLLLTVMREIFYRNSNDPDALLIAVQERSEYDFRRMIFGDAPQIIDTLYRHEQDVNTLKKHLKDSLLQNCESLGGIWKELLMIPPLRRRFIDNPLRLNINDLQCYASPLLAYSDGGALRIVELRAGRLDGHPEISFMHRFYALNNSGRTPDSVHSCQLDPVDGSFRELHEDSRTANVLRSMSLEAGAHRKELDLPLAEVPVNTVNCPECVFNLYCRTNFRQQ